MSFCTLSCDVAILGGGIAGLWALNRLRQQGLEAVLLEPYCLGGGQTIKSQGIIHGGIKYTLKGRLTGSAKAIAAMPLRWRQCLEGQGDIDLRSVQILSPHYHLWSTGGLSSNVSNFLASKVLNSNNALLAPGQYPVAFQHPSFKGSVYQVDEWVLNARSLIETLANPCLNAMVKIDPNYQFEIDGQHALKAITTVINGQSTRIEAQRYLFTAGEGNAHFLRACHQERMMQYRPLHMVWVKVPHQHPLFAHCIGAQSTPRITITSHPTVDGGLVWYLGGQLAEEGVGVSKEQQINLAQQEITALFPWLDFKNSYWGSLMINRAEERQPDGKRPESVGLKQPLSNCWVAWPTKLTLAPYLVDQLMNHWASTPLKPMASSLPRDMEKPSICAFPWDEIQ